MRFAALALCSLLWAASVHADPRISSISAKAGTGNEATIRVSIDRPTPLDIMKCEVAVDLGDGSKPMQFVFNIGDKHMKTNTHTYKKSGTYVLKASGTCKGSAEAKVTVGGKSASADAAKPSCPSGWTLGVVKEKSFLCKR
jgi:hypothetical protein